MNKFVLSALALTTASGYALAGTGSEEWLTLDREIETLASTLAPQGSSGVTVSGFLRTSYQNSSDFAVGANDLGGFNLDNTRLNVDGNVGDFSVHISADSAPVGSGGLWGALNPGGAIGIIDAHASWNVNEQLAVTMGQFRPPFLASSMYDEDGLLFLDRDFQSLLFSFRDQGVMLGGNYDSFGWGFAIQNGIDGAGDDLAFAANVAFHAMGAGSSSTEGAYGNDGQGNGLNVSAGYYQDDDTVADVSAFNVAGDFSTGALYLAATFLDLNSGFGDATPYNATVSFMFVPDRWEAALRYEDLDTATSTTVLTLGVNYYLQGHDAKWQLNFGQLDDDVADASIFGIGLTTSV